MFAEDATQDGVQKGNKLNLIEIFIATRIISENRAQQNPKCHKFVGFAVWSTIQICSQ